MTRRVASMLLVDDDEHFLRSFTEAFEARGIRVWTARTFEAASKVLATRSPSYVVSELRVAGRWLTDYLKDNPTALPFDHLGVITAYPSVATAFRFGRLGAAAFLTKPAPPAALLEELRRGSDTHSVLPAPFEPAWPTLKRTIWEYVCQVFVSAGSVSEAARRLGINRHSLRRMLARCPPES